MITLSDGSTYLHRTTSPAPIYRSTKDTKNNALWNPSSQKLKNVEEDEAGRLKAFRGRFGRGWDAEAVADGEEVSCFFVSHLGEKSCFGNLMANILATSRHGKAKRVCRSRRARRACWISSLDMDRRLRRRARRPVKGSPKRAAGRAREARSERFERSRLRFENFERRFAHECRSCKKIVFAAWAYAKAQGARVFTKKGTSYIGQAVQYGEKVKAPIAFEKVQGEYLECKIRKLCWLQRNILFSA